MTSKNHGSLIMLIALAVAVSNSGCGGGSASQTSPNGTVKLIPDTLGFGVVKVGTTSSAGTTLTNTGTSTLTITSITITGNAGAFSQTNTCGGSVAAGGSCTITVTFKPSGASRYTGDITITDSGADSPQQVPMLGKGSTSLTAAMQAALSSSSTATVPSPTGPSSVGTRVMHLVDSSRSDPYAANGTRRQLLVRFWYPASLVDGCKPAEYTSQRVWSYFSELVGVPLPVVMTNSCKDAPVTDGEHPVVVFSHGYTGTYTDYTFIFEDLASRGYIVASVDHTYEATAIEFPDGSFVESVPGSHLGNIVGNNERDLAFAVSVRLDDLRFVADELERLNAAPAGPFTDKLDTSQVAVAGHSLGGLTAILSAEREPRFKTGIILDGVVAPKTSVGAIVTPMLLLVAGREGWSDAECRLWSEIHAAHFAVNLRGAEHLTPSDLIWLTKGAIKTGDMGPERTITAIRNYIATFLDANLRGQPLDPLLTGPSSDYPDAEVTTQNQLLCGKP